MYYKFKIIFVIFVLSLTVSISHAEEEITHCKNVNLTLGQINGIYILPYIYSRPQDGDIGGGSYNHLVLKTKDLLCSIGNGGFLDIHIKQDGAITLSHENQENHEILIGYVKLEELKVGTLRYVKVTPLEDLEFEVKTFDRDRKFECKRSEKIPPFPSCQYYTKATRHIFISNKIDKMDFKNTIYY